MLWSDIEDGPIEAKGEAMSTRELQAQLVTSLREWQKLEDAQITLIGDMLGETHNPAVAMILEIIQRDSQMHHRVQQLIIDSLESEVVGLTGADVELIRRSLHTHLDMEMQTVKLAEQNLAAMAGRRLDLQELFMEFLRRDEEKHRDMLLALERFLDSGDDDQTT